MPSSSSASHGAGRRRARPPDPEYLRVAFLHPDLGLGGAERLVVDAAAELAARGHPVDIFTSHFDPSRCFDECRSGAFSVIEAGAWLPRSLFGGRFVALCALLRCCFAAAVLAWHARRGGGGRSGGAGPVALGRYHVVIVDQVAGVVPVLRILLALAAWLVPAAAPPSLVQIGSMGGRGRAGAANGRRLSPAPTPAATPVKPPTPTRILFYCHFPDLLLSGERPSLLKRLYRLPLDTLEQAATGSADRCLVNSRFTAGIFRETFPRLARKMAPPRVLYPAAAVPTVEELLEAASAWPGELRMTREQLEVVRAAAADVEAAVVADAGNGTCIALQSSKALGNGNGGANGNGAVAAAAAAASPATAVDDDLALFVRGGPTLLSINRFERKKGLSLALHALRRVLDDESEARQQRRQGGRRRDNDNDDDSNTNLLPPANAPRLVLAGGHDPRLPENREHLRELMLQAKSLGLQRHVRWLPSFSSRQRALLLAGCKAVLYTPLGEHFGIVPLEAMAAARPVVCMASGGPLESVVDGRTGFLCDPPDAERVAGAWRAVAASSGEGGSGGGVSAAMGLAARAHVESRFSRRAFGDALERELRELVESNV
jgi:glycosyltransferase involved in cell wall biosynthesis